MKDRTFPPKTKPRRKIDFGPPLAGESQAVNHDADEAHVAAANKLGGFTKETFWNLRPPGVADTRGFVEAIKALEGKR